MDLPAYWRTLYHMLPYSMKHGKHHLIFKRRRVLQKHAFAASPSEEFDAILAGCRTLCGSPYLFVLRKRQRTDALSEIP